jgi:hypothetical protein
MRISCSRFDMSREWRQPPGDGMDLKGFEGALPAAELAPVPENQFDPPGFSHARGVSSGEGAWGTTPAFPSLLHLINLARISEGEITCRTNHGGWEGFISPIALSYLDE